MRPPATETPEISDAAARARTGKVLEQWFAHLDAHVDRAGGIARGRRELVNHLWGAAFERLKQTLEGA